VVAAGSTKNQTKEVQITLNEKENECIIRDVRQKNFNIPKRMKNMKSC